MLMFTNAQLVLARQLRAEAVDVVVGAPDRDQVGAVDAGREELLFLEIGRDEHVGLEPSRGGVGGDRVGQIPGRGAGDRLKPELARTRERDRDDPVLERVRRVGGVVLDPHLASPSAWARRSARSSGVHPAGSVPLGGATGRKSV